MKKLVIHLEYDEKGKYIGLLDRLNGAIGQVRRDLGCIHERANIQWRFFDTFEEAAAWDGHWYDYPVPKSLEKYLTNH